MNLIPSPPPHGRRIIEQLLEDRCRGPGPLFLGLSGGLDSALVMELAVSAVGRDRVRPIFLPNGSLSSEDLEPAKACCRNHDLELEIIEISPMIEAFPLKLDGMALGNVAARTRMMVLYGLANRDGGYVLGTSNKSEILLGYFTKHGDGASDMAPVGDLFKTQVRDMAREVGVPEEIIRRPPTANLVPGQTDEGELGLPYSILDQILTGHVLGSGPEEILSDLNMSVVTDEERDLSGIGPGIDIGDVRRVIDIVRSTRHKRGPLLIPKLGSYTVSLDLKERW